MKFVFYITDYDYAYTSAVDEGFPVNLDVTTMRTSGIEHTLQTNRPLCVKYPKPLRRQSVVFVTLRVI